jgi:UDP-N-acetylmuramate-alanine ligase
MPDIAVINGIAWDHMNVFPTFENYVEQYRIFAGKITEGGSLIYYDGDTEAAGIAAGTGSNIRKIPYRIHGYFQNKTGFYAATHNRVVPVKVFGEHNMQNLSAAREACLASGVSEDGFYNAIMSFEGTSKRLQKLKENEKGIIFLDFAHSPSKVKATVDAVVSRFPKRNVIACLELHTYSSLSSGFLPLYKGTMAGCKASFVYFSHHAIAMKRLEPLLKEDVKKAFGEENLTVFDNSDEMFSAINNTGLLSPVYLFMSSGDFDGYDITEVLN